MALEKQNAVKKSVKLLTAEEFKFFVSHMKPVVLDILKKEQEELENSIQELSDKSDPQTHQQVRILRKRKKLVEGFSPYDLIVFAALSRCPSEPVDQKNLSEEEKFFLHIAHQEEVAKDVSAFHRIYPSWQEELPDIVKLSGISSRSKKMRCMTNEQRKKILDDEKRLFFCLENVGGVDMECKRFFTTPFNVDLSRDSGSDDQQDCSAEKKFHISVKYTEKDTAQEVRSDLTSLRDVCKERRKKKRKFTGGGQSPEMNTQGEVLGGGPSHVFKLVKKKMKCHKDEGR